MLGLHGWGRNRRDLGGLLEATGHESLAVDLPGFGASVEPTRVWGSAEYGDELAGQVVSTGMSPPFVVVGHSFGGRVGVRMAANHPHLVGGLVLMGVPLVHAGGRPSVSVRYRFIRAAVRARLLSHGRLESARRRFGSDDYRSSSGVMRDVLVRVVSEDYRDDLRRVRCPIALVWGTEDRITPLLVARRAAALASRVVLFEAVAGAGHDVHIDAPARVHAAIRAVAAEL